MNLNRPEVLRALMAAAALVFVVALVGAFTVDGDDTKVAASGDTRRTTTTLAVEDTTTTVAVDDLTVTTVGSAPASSSTTRPAVASANVGDPGPARPPAAGTYTYSFTNDAEPSLNGNNERKVEEMSPEGGSPRRRTTAKDAAGNTLVNEEKWSNDGVRATTSRISGGGFTIDCVWEPALLELALPLSVGKTWKTDSTCTTSVSGTRITIRRVGDSKVTGKALDRVGDTDVPTWIIETTGTTTVRSAFYNEDTKEKVTAHYASARGLVTKENGTTESGSRKVSYELTLQSLTPK